MLKMMAADNDDGYNLSPGFILETVEAARKFITRDKKGAFTHQAVAKFLGWPPPRVQHALAQLGAIEREDLSREAVKKLHSQREAVALHAGVQERKKRVVVSFGNGVEPKMLSPTIIKLWTAIFGLSEIPL
jgi:hypothetical protein